MQVSPHLLWYHETPFTPDHFFHDFPSRHPYFLNGQTDMSYASFDGAFHFPPPTTASPSGIDPQNVLENSSAIANFGELSRNGDGRMSACYASELSGSLQQWPVIHYPS
jgi:hypothetical protein